MASEIAEEWTTGYQLLHEIIAEIDFNNEADWKDQEKETAKEEPL